MFVTKICREWGFLQGLPWLSALFELSLTERNMDAKIYLKVVLKSWDYDIFGTTTSFCEMHTLRPLIDQMSVTLGFKKISWFLFKFSLILLKSIWQKILLVMKDCLIMMTWCFIFEVPWHVIATVLMIIVKSLTIHFSDVL